jgi:hypothetical protein
MKTCNVCGAFHREHSHCHVCGALAISDNCYIDVATNRWIGRARGIRAITMKRASRLPQYVQMCARQNHLAAEN